MTAIHGTLADIIWPGLLMQYGVVVWWVIAIGLVVEFFFVRMITQLPWWKCLVAALVMNLASTVLGFILIPIGSIVIGIFPGLPLEYIFRNSNFGATILPWSLTFIGAAMINATLEIFVLRLMFSQWFGKRGFWLLCAANSISVGLAIIHVLVAPPNL